MAAFVDDPAYSSSTTRAALWAHWGAAKNLLLGSVRTYRAWVGGSFLTNKVDPNDIDVAYLVSGEYLNFLSPVAASVVQAFMSRRLDPATGRVLPGHGLRIDSYLVFWEPFHLDSTGNMGPEYTKYANKRGFYDDFWMRRRSGSKTDPLTRADTVTRRGYLEVVFNDFS